MRAPPRSGRARAFLLPLAIAVAWAALDQALKLYTVANLEPAPARVEAIPGFLALTYAQNRGAAWSLFDGSVVPLTILRAAAAVGILAYLAARPGLTRLQVVAGALVAGGAIGNALDGVTRGYVVDTLLSHALTAVYRPLFGGEFPVFNLADVGVVSGVILLLLAGFAEPARGKREG